MIGLSLGLALMMAVIALAMHHSCHHDTGIDELIAENNTLKERILHLEQDLEKYRRLQA